ncbi:MAG TPA: AI-2E family transporter [Ktedonobacterales bacterium]
MSRDLLQRHGVLRLLLYVTTIIVVLHAAQLIWSTVQHFSDAILIFFLAWIVYFILRPLATFLQRRGLPRVVAVIVIYCCLLGVATGSIVLAIPIIRSQVIHVAAELTTTFAPGNLTTLTTRAAAYLRGLGLSAKEARALVDQASGQVPAWTGALTSQAVDAATSLFGAIFSLLFDCVLVTMLSFYMMLDGDRLLRSAVRRLPPSWHPDVYMLQSQIELSFGGFLRAQLIVALVYGTLSGVVLVALGQPNGLLVAALAGLLMLIPFIGPFLAIVPPALLVLLQAPDNTVLRDLIIAVIALVIAQQITMKLVAPQVMSAHVGLHPLVLLAALLVGAQEGGIWGALFAAPLAAVVVSMLDVFFVRFQQSSSLYPDITPDTQALQKCDADEDLDVRGARTAARAWDEVPVR